MSELELELADGVLTAKLNRPEVRNALNRATVDGLHRVLDRADLDADVRVVLLRGAGKDFCAGADLQELLASADRPPADNEQDAMRLGTVFTRMRSLPKPVVAAVHGRALAGGAGLATACDIVLATESSQFGYPEIQRGFVPAMVMTLLRRVTTEKRAFELVATGRLLAATEAFEAGLVTRVAPDARFEAMVAEVVSALTGASPTALALTKQLFYDLDGAGVADGIALGARVNALSRTTPDFRAAISRFLAR